MAKLPILNGENVQITLSYEGRKILDMNLLALYLINKYGGEDIFMSVHIPARIDEDSISYAPINYDIIIKETLNGQV